MTVQPPPVPSDPHRPTGHAHVPPAARPPVSGPPFGGAGAAAPVSPVSPPASGAAPKERRKRSWAGPIALLALLVAAGSAVLAWRAMDQAADAKAIALRGGASASTAGPQNSVAPPSGAAKPTGGTAPGVADPSVPPSLNAQTVFDLKYDNTEMRVQAPCGAVRYLDVDRPQVDSGSAGFDLALRGPCPSVNAVSLQLGDDVKAINDVNPDITPNDCFSRISLSAVAPDSKVAIKQGSVLCVWTSLNAAQGRGDLSQLVVIEVRGIASDDTVTMRLKAWKVPA